MRWPQREATTHNRECRSDSNQYTLLGKNLTNMPYAWLPEALTYDNHLRSPYSIEIGLLSTGEVMALTCIPSATTSLRQGVQFSEVVTGLLGLSSPIKTWHVVSTQHKTTTLEPQNIHGPLPTLPFRVNPFSLIAPPNHIHNTWT
jgi:hypothetical protein